MKNFLGVSISSKYLVKFWFFLKRIPQKKTIVGIAHVVSAKVSGGI